MTPDAQSIAAAYLAPSVDAFWRWTADGEAMTWVDGKTIAFRQEVEAVLRRLAPGGLPPFGSVALLLAAGRDGWEGSDWRDRVVGYANVFERWKAGTGEPRAVPLHASQFVFQRIARDVGRVIDGLDAVARLPRDLRDNTQAKTVLAETVFEPAAKRLAPEDAALVIRALDDGINPELLLPRLTTRESLSLFAEDVDGLRLGLPKVDPKALALRLRTGLDETPKSADVDLGPPEQVRRLLAELRADLELSGLAKLARDLMAAVYVPRALQARDEMPLGGVSDLSNRGPLDRLLVSELAHDDLTLAVRVAVNEALYLRRESPPKSPPVRRAILLDQGIRLWGVPRVFATAVALALAATADPRGELLTFRAAAGKAEPVDLTTREGLLACLAALEPAPHPGAAVGAFLDALDAGAGAGAAEETSTDAILITHPDVLHDPEFAATLAAVEEPMYVATVDRAGGFELLTATRAGRKSVRRAELALDAILGLETPKPPPGPRRPRTPQPGVPLIAERADPNLPVILSTQPFPFRLPYNVDPALCAVSVSHGLFAATKDGRLLHWDGPSLGGRQLTTDLPPGRVIGVHIDDDTARAFAVVVNPHLPTQMIIADLTSGRCTRAELKTAGVVPVGACFRGGVCYLIHKRQVEAFALASAGRLGSAHPDIAGLTWHRDRFFRRAGGAWHVLAHDGNAVRFEEVPHTAREAVALFDRTGHDGPWQFLSDGRLIDGLGHDCTTFARPATSWSFLGVSRDGGRVAVQTKSGAVVVDLAAGEVTPAGINYDQLLLAPQINWAYGTGSLRTKFRGVFYGARGELGLVSRQDTAVFVVRGADGGLTLRNAGGFPSVNRPLQTFVRLRGRQQRLMVAAWDDGSRAYLDGRGLLHLKSADKSLPEISLVLSDQTVAAWSSEGKVCGPAYFIGDATPTDPGYFDDLVHRFTARLR